MTGPVGSEAFLPIVVMAGVWTQDEPSCEITQCKHHKPRRHDTVVNQSSTYGDYESAPRKAPAMPTTHAGTQDPVTPFDMSAMTSHTTATTRHKAQRTPSQQQLSQHLTSPPLRPPSQQQPQLPMPQLQQV